MKLFPSTILVTANLDQKQSVEVGGMTFQIVPNRGMYEQNARETNPVLMQVVQAADNVPLKSGDFIIGHHNVITDAIWKIDDRHVVPFDRWILAKVKEDGWLEAMPGNIIAERIQKPIVVGVWFTPDSGYYEDKVKTDNGLVLGIRKWGDYEVCYNWNGEVRRKIVLWEDDVVCQIVENDIARLIQEEGNKNYEQWKKLFNK